MYMSSNPSCRCKGSPHAPYNRLVQVHLSLFLQKINITSATPTSTHAVAERPFISAGDSPPSVTLSCDEEIAHQKEASRSGTPSLFST